MKCLVCGKEFTPNKYNPRQKYCSEQCLKKAYAESLKARNFVRPTKIEKPQVQGKTLADWCREADECNLDYGTYRAFIAQGKTFEELKSQKRSPQNHSHIKTNHGWY